MASMGGGGTGLTATGNAAAGAGLGFGFSLGIFQTIQAEKEARKAAKLNQQIGFIERDEQRRQTQALVGAQRVAFTSSGVDPNTGTPLDIQGNTAAEGELAGLRRQFGFELAAFQIREQGKAEKRAAVFGALQNTFNILSLLGSGSGSGQPSSSTVSTNRAARSTTIGGSGSTTPRGQVFTPTGRGGVSTRV